MTDLTVTGVDDGALVLQSRTGEQFRLVIDEVLHSHLRRSRTAAPTSSRVSPRDIQAHLRAGLSANDVAELLGAAPETVERFEGPINAELAHMVASALSVPVVAADELDEHAEPTFGTAIRHRIGAVNASDEQWSSWKDVNDGWRVKLTFVAQGVEHDARWAFDPKRHSLTPINERATQLSRPGAAPSTLIPKLRAVDVEVDQPTAAFDPEAFVVADDSESVQARLPRAARDAIHRDDDADRVDHNHTADLLEALRRRRGERESAPEFRDDDPGESPADSKHAASRLQFGASIPEKSADLTPPRETTADTVDERSAPNKRVRPVRKGRASLPSWDEIVFGAKTDDD